MSRREIYFPLKDRPLREDVSALGLLVGQVLQDQGGERLLEIVETARTAAIQRREGDPDAEELLKETVCSLPSGDEREVIRAFSTYFQVVNLAEQIHRIRRRRDYLHAGNNPQPGSLEDAVQHLAQAGHGLDAVQELLNNLLIEPVFTAHPTEATRRTILEKHLRVARRLVERMDPSLTHPEEQAALGRIRTEITTLWQTEEHPSARRSVSDELEHVLFYLTDILYRIIPPFYEALQGALVRVYGKKARNLQLPTILRFASWVGGDMDGNPNVTPETIRATLVQHRALILRLYQKELDEQYERLSQSASRVGVSEEVRKRIDQYAMQFPHVLQNISLRHHDMPYRLYIRFIQDRLKATGNDSPEGYQTTDQFIEDLQCIVHSLRENRGRHAGLFSFRRLVRRAQTFGFYLATLDIRQDALVLRTAMGHLLGESGWTTMDAQARTLLLVQALTEHTEPRETEDAETQKTLEVFRAIAECRTRYGPRAIGPFIISMTQGPDDVLTVLLMARWCGLTDPGGTVQLDVAPLFETVSDLSHSAQTMSDLLTCQPYLAHLEARGNRQIVMIGYSDSNKDGGYAASRWALRQAEETLASVLEKAGVDLTVFHGRGGTTSRGGGKFERAILSAPPGTVRGKLRVTEQGEIIHSKYGLRGIAMRELEQTVGAVARATVLPASPDRPEWRTLLDTISETSRNTYRDLVYKEPAFLEYFRLATPIDVIERLQIGSRPASRRTRQGIQNLRAIPWVFAWMQSRHILPGWYGLGTGLSAAIEKQGEATVSAAIQEWGFLNHLIDDAEMVLAKTDMAIAAHYAELAGEPLQPIFNRIRQEHTLTVDLILKLKNTQQLLDEDPTLQRAIRLRNPYIDPISLLQVHLLGEWRASDRENTDLFSALLATVNGIAEGLQNTG